MDAIQALQSEIINCRIDSLMCKYLAKFFKQTEMFYPFIFLIDFIYINN